MAAMTVFRGWTLTEQGIAPRQVTVRDGIITAVADYDAPRTPIRRGALITLADDEVLLPGLVDTHVHVNEPGRTEWEGFATATQPPRPVA
jgi:allantoinase